jgi:hypothetical protein
MNANKFRKMLNIKRWARTFKPIKRGKYRINDLQANVDFPFIMQIAYSTLQYFERIGFDLIIRSGYEHILVLEEDGFTKIYTTDMHLVN